MSSFTDMYFDYSFLLLIYSTFAQSIVGYVEEYRSSSEKRRAILIAIPVSLLGMFFLSLFLLLHLSKKRKSKREGNVSHVFTNHFCSYLVFQKAKPYHIGKKFTPRFISTLQE